MEQSIEQVPTRKKQAIAALCLAKFCAEKKIHHPVISQIIEHLLSVLITSDLPQWNSKTISLEPNKSLRDSIRPTLPQDISEPLFYDLLNAVLEVGWTNMYTRPSNEPLNQLRKVLAILEHTGITAPPLESSFYTRNNEDSPYYSGWGEPLDPGAYEKVLNVYRRIADL